MTKTLSNIETFTMSRENYETILRCCDARRLPVAGIIKRYRGFQFDDFGNKQLVFISSTERANENGDITWSEAFA
jgi:hypothetical protein